MAELRILQVFTSMNRGGSESMIMNYYRKIDKNKIQFDFLVHRNEKADFDNEILSLGGNIYRFDPISPFFPKKYYNKLRVFFKEHPEYSIIHAHLNTFSCFPLKIAKEFNIKCRIAHAHIAMEDFRLKDIISSKESLKEVLKTIVKLQLRKYIHKYTTHKFACGQKAGHWLFGYKSEFRIMNNAILSEHFNFNQQISENYKKNFNLFNELIIGHVGRFSSQKNHTFLLKVFNELLKKQKNCKLVLIGVGPLMSVIKNEAIKLDIIDKIEFLGLREDIPQLLQMMDFFVFPSFYEGLPVTLIEAQAAGVKIIASDTITKEVSITKDIEYLSINLSPKLWAEKIIKNYPYKKRNNHKDIVENKYDIVESSSKIQEFYLKEITC